MNNDRLRQVDPAGWFAQLLREKENARLNTNKIIVRNLLVQHGAEDLIPMLLED